MSHVKTDETRQMWTRTLVELRELMEQRAQLFIWQLLAKQELLKVPLPDRIDDEYGAPPVVVWLGPLQQKEKAGGKPSELDWGNRSVRQRWAFGSQSWSEQWLRR